ncbi:sensor histidine kinase [Flavobacterium sp. XS2P14]|uniref:sensor histidine kinase n=1 Tax=Flavobacterium sp. XS2P14 TaxID=3401735 RepID=UPI003AAD4226
MDKRILLLVILFFGVVNAQNKSVAGIDSLKVVLNGEINIVKKCNLLVTITEYYLENDLDSSAVFLKKTERFATKYKVDCDINIELLKINVYLTRGEFDLAENKINSFKITHLKKCDKNQILLFNYLQANIYYKIGDLHTFLKITNDILIKHKAIKTTIIAKIHLLRASAFFQMRNRNMMTNINAAIEIFKVTKNYGGISNCYMLLCYSNLDINLINRAVSYAALANKKNEFKSRAELIRLNLVLGTVYFAQKNFALAKKTLKKTIENNKKLHLNQVASIANRYINLSNLALGNYSELINDLKHQEQFAITDYEKHSFHEQLATAYIKIKNFKNAKISLSKMEKINAANKNSLKSQILEYLKLAIVIEENLGNYKKALAYSKLYSDTYNSITDSLNSQTVLKYQVGFETKEKELELKDLKIAAQKNKTNLVQKENQRNLLLAIILFTVVLLLLSYVFYRKIRVQNVKLEEKAVEIENKNLEIQKSNKTIKKTFSIIAHDLRDPFNAILGYASYITDNFNEITAVDLQKYIQSIYNSADKNYQLTQQLLTWSLKQQDGFVLNKGNYDVNEVLSHAIEKLYSIADQRNIKIINQTPDNLFYNLDKDIISNIVHNILANAIKFSINDAEIIVEAAITPNKLRIKITDYGTGINEQDLLELNNHINYQDSYYLKFNKGYQGGFGLMYSKELVLLHGGTMIFESGLNQGTTVVIYV